MLKTKRDDRVAVLTIDRPGRRNAISSELIGALRAALLEFDADPGIGCIVLGGEPPGFCAGSDLKELATLNLAQMSAHEAETAAVSRLIGMIDKPVLAAVSGFALGGGFVLAAACDVVFSTPEARWHLPEVTIGWIPPWGLETLAARVGPVRARRLTWGAAAIDGREAHRLGIVDELAADPLAEAIAEARRLAALPSPAVAATKRYFAQLAAPCGEPRDMLANRMFAENCQHPVACATLKRFGVSA